MVQGLGFGVWGLGVGVWGSVLLFEDLGFRVQGFGFRVKGVLAEALDSQVVQPVVEQVPPLGRGRAGK